MKFVRKKDFFVGIDSDGTAFDTMTVKHTYAFIPCIIKQWQLQTFEKEVYETAEYINLYSSTRGINRFPGLVMIFDMLKEKLGERFDVGDYSSLRDFCESGAGLSNGGLEGYMEKHNDAFLEKVLLWSKEADVEFSKKAHGLPPFENMAETVAKIKNYADIAVISAASAKSLKADWESGGVLEKVDYVAGQEQGSKAEQLKIAEDAGYLPEKCLMIGDGIGDRDAAKKHGFCFYPIVPTRETESWKALFDTYFDMFLNGTYKGAVEDGRYREFLEFLMEGK